MTSFASKSKRQVFSEQIESFSLFSNKITNQVSAHIIHQAKEFVTLNTSKQHKSGEGLHGNSLDADQSNRVKQLEKLVGDGFLMTDCFGPMQNLLLELEEFVIIYATHYSSNSTVSFDIKDLAEYLITITFNICQVDVTKSFNLYCRSLVSQIRVCLRVLASKDPVGFVSKMEQILSKFLSSGELSLFKELTFSVYATNTRFIQSNRIFYQPLIDEPFHNIIQFRPKFEPIWAPQGGNVAFEVTICGFKQIRGVYNSVDSKTPKAGAKKSNVEYINVNGYVLSRSTYKISTSEWQKKKSGSAKHTDFAVTHPTVTTYHCWRLYNPDLQNKVYYTCITIVSSPYPPREGWNCTVNGRLPCPVLKVVIIPVTKDIADTTVDLVMNAVQSIVPSKKTFPLHADMFLLAYTPSSTATLPSLSVTPPPLSVCEESADVVSPETVISPVKQAPMQTSSYILQRSSKMSRLSSNNLLAQATAVTLEVKVTPKSPPRIKHPSETDIQSEAKSESVRTRLSKARKARPRQGINSSKSTPNNESGSNTPPISRKVALITPYSDDPYALHQQHQHQKAKRTILKGQLIVDANVRTPPPPKKSISSTSLLAASFQRVDSKDKEDTTAAAIFKRRGLEREPSGYVSSDGEDNVLSELGVSMSYSMSMSRQPSQEISYVLSPSPAPSIVVTPASASSTLPELKKKKSFDFMTEFIADVVDDDLQLDFLAEPWNINCNERDNAITAYCEGIQEKISHTKKILSLKRDWVTNSDPDSLIYGRPTIPAITSITSPTVQSGRKERTSSDMSVGSVSSDTSDPFLGGGGGPIMMEGGGGSTKSISSIITSGMTSIQSSSAPLSPTTPQGPDQYDSALYAQIFPVDKHSDVMRTNSVMTYTQQQDAIIHENWNISALVTRHRIEIIKNENKQGMRSNDISSSTSVTQLITNLSSAVLSPHITPIKNPRSEQNSMRHISKSTSNVPPVSPAMNSMTSLFDFIKNSAFALSPQVPPEQRSTTQHTVSEKSDVKHSEQHTVSRSTLPLAPNRAPRQSSEPLHSSLYSGFDGGTGTSGKLTAEPVGKRRSKSETMDETSEKLSLHTTSISDGGLSANANTNTGTVPVNPPRPQSLFSTLPTYGNATLNANSTSNSSIYGHSGNTNTATQGLRVQTNLNTAGSSGDRIAAHGSSGMFSHPTTADSSPSFESRKYAMMSPRSPESPMPSEESFYFQQQLQHLNNLERAHKREDAESCLADLCEMTLPERYHNDFKCKISILGVEMWPPARPNARHPVPEKLNYVLRIWLSDVRHNVHDASMNIEDFTETEKVSPSEHTERSASRPGMSPLDAALHSQPGMHTPPLHTSLKTSLSVKSTGSILDLELSESVADEYSSLPLTPATSQKELGLTQSGNNLNGVLNMENTSANSSGNGKSLLYSVEGSPSPLPTEKVMYMVEGSYDIPQPDDVIVALNPAEEKLNKAIESAVTVVAETSKTSPFDHFTKTIVDRSRNASIDESWSVFTVRRDLQALGALHAELSHLLKDTEIQVPTFPDPYHIGNTEEELIRNVFNSPAEKKKLRFGTTAFLYSKVMRDPFSTVGVETNQEGCGLDNIDNVMVNITQYLDAVFAIVSFIDELVADSGYETEYFLNSQNIQHTHELKKNNNLSNGDLSNLASSIDSVSAIPVNGTMKYTDSTHDLLCPPSTSMQSKTSQHMSEGLQLYEISKKLGKLIGNFLQSTECLNDILDSSGGNTVNTVNNSNNNEKQQSNKGNNNSRNTEMIEQNRIMSEIMTPSSISDLQNSITSNNNSSNTNSYQQTSHNLTQHNLNNKRPCWYQHTNTGLKLRANFNIHKGMKLDADLLRIQRSRCLGCSLPLSSNLFGFDCNYASCRYYGGLFCKRWCHTGELRQVPTRLLQYWDNKQYKVCNQALYFIDHISNKPLLNLSVINPLLFEGVPMLRQVYRLRAHIAKLVGRLIEYDSNNVKVCILNTIGKTKAHLCIANEIFSLHDIIHIHSGLLLINLQNLYNGLLVIKRGLKKNNNNSSSNREIGGMYMR